MNLTSEQIKKLRKPFDEVGAFEECSEETVEKLLKGMMEFWVTLAKINLRIKREEVGNKKNSNGA